MTDTLDPDETGFDAELRALAVRIMDEEGASPGIFGRAWHEDGIFRAMQCYAVATPGTKAKTLVRCEALAREHARLYRVGTMP